MELSQSSFPQICIESMQKRKKNHLFNIDFCLWTYQLGIDNGQQGQKILLKRHQAQNGSLCKVGFG